MSTSNIEQSRYDAKTAAASRTVYFRKGGNDNNSGLSDDEAVTAENNFARVLAVVASLVPTGGDPVTIICEESDDFPANLVLPDFVNFIGPGVRLQAINDLSPVLSMGTGCVVDVDTVDAAGGVALSYNNVFATSFTARRGVTSNTGKAIEHMGNANGNSIFARFVVAATTCIENSSASTDGGLEVIAGILTLTANNGIYVDSQAANETYVRAAYTETAGSPTGLTGIKAAGPVRAVILNCVADQVIDALSGADLCFDSGCAAGDIDVAAGATVNALIAAPLGGTAVVTVTGTLNANIGGARYGTYTLPGGGDVNGPGSATPDALAVYDGPTGKLIKNSTKLITEVVTNVSGVGVAGNVPIFTSADDLEDSGIDINDLLEVDDIYHDYAQTVTPGATNDGGVFHTYLSLAVNVPATDDYKITVDYIWSYDSTSSDFLSELQIDSVTPAFLTQQEEPADSGGPGLGGIARIDGGGGTLNSGTNQRLPAVMSSIENLTAGAHTIDFNIQSGAGSVATCYRALITIERWT